MDGLVQCLICGKWWRSVGHHVRVAHGISAREYRDAFGIPRSRKLTAQASREKWSASMQGHILADGCAESRDAMKYNAVTRGAQGAAAKRELATAGRVFGGHNAIDRDVIASLVTRAERGERPYQIAREIGISWTGVFTALRRFPDLHARYRTLPIKRGRKKISE